MTEGVLRMLGLSAEDAAAICSSPLPSPTELLAAAMPGLQQEPGAG